MAPLSGNWRLQQGELHVTILFTLFLSCLFYFYFILFAFIIEKHKKLVLVLFPVFTLVKMSSLENTKLCDFTGTNNNDFICTPIAPPASKAESYEIKPALLNLVMREQFSGVITDDAASHLNNFVELCDMQKYKEVEGDILSLNYSLSL